MNLSEKTRNRICSLYEQCLNAYNDFMKEYNADVVFNNKPWPGPLCDSFNVPAEIMFRELCKVNKAWIDCQPDYLDKLLDYIVPKRDFNVEEFVRFSKKDVKIERQKFVIYLELYYRLNDGRHNRVFPNNLTIDGASISWTSKKELSDIDSKYISGNKYDNHGYINGDEKPLREMRKFPRLKSSSERDIHPIKIEVYAINSFAALNFAMQKIQILLDCLNFVQTYNITTQRIFSGGKDNLKEEVVIVDTGIYLVVCGDEIERHYSLKRRDSIPGKKITRSKKKNKLFQEICSAATNRSPIMERLRKILDDYSLACVTNNVGLRHLSYWRCLEHATRRTSGMSRSEEEILRIFKNYYSDDKAWSQMAILIRENRNRYVHEGIAEAGSGVFVDLYIRWAKSYAVVAVWIMVYLYRKKELWDTNEKIDYFFDFYSKSDEELSVARELYRTRHEGQN